MDEQKRLESEIPEALFEVGEFVYDCKFTKGNKENAEIVEMGSRSFTESRGWVYSINYRTIDKETGDIKSGGSSCCWNESDFKKLDDPLLLLFIKKHKLEKEKREKEAAIRVIEDRLKSLRYAIGIAKGVTSS